MVAVNPKRTRQPQQERSRLRVARLLAAAEQILESDGYDALTIARVTKAAGVPVGTFYQFFEDKEAIVGVLAQRYVAWTASLISELVDDVANVPVGSRMATALEAFIDLYRRNPAYRVLRTGSYTSTELRRADNANVGAAVDGVRRLLTTGTGIADSKAVRSTARTLQLLMDALLYRASEVPAKDVKAFLGEASSMLNVLEINAIERLLT